MDIIMLVLEGENMKVLSILCETAAQLQCQTKQFQEHPILTL